MSERTDIDWCDSTVNPTSGCDGCELFNPAQPDEATCYAKGIHENRLAHSFPANYGASFDEVRMIPGRMAKAASWRDLRGTVRAEKPWLNGLPRLVFISDMADALSRPVTFEFLRDEVIETVRRWKHIGLWLTKRPQRMAEFDGWLNERGESWPANLWAGTSVTSERYKFRVGQLLKVRAPVRFVSAEPLLGALDLSAWLIPDPVADNLEIPESGCVNWLIGGGESALRKNRPGQRRPAPMHPNWLRSLRDQCQAARVPFFFKQWGNWRPHPHPPVRGKNTGYGICLTEKGEWGNQGMWWDGTAQAMDTMDKDEAGAVLDGREWREMPTIIGGGEGGR